MQRKTYLSSLVPISRRPRLSFVFRVASIFVCVSSLAIVVMSASRARSDGSVGRARVFVAKSPEIEPPLSAPLDYKWNIDNTHFPLLSFFGEHPNPAMERSLSYPMGRNRFLVFENLNYDEERDAYILPSISSDGVGTHLIEFEATKSSNSFVSMNTNDLRLIDNGARKIIRAGDGTSYLFLRYSDGEFRCADIRNVANHHLNFIYTSNGLKLHGVEDSGGRTVTFNYDDDGIASISQTWIVNAAALQKTWIVVDQSTKPLLPSNYLRPGEFTSFQKIPANALVREYTRDMTDSD